MMKKSVRHWLGLGCIVWGCVWFTGGCSSAPVEPDRQALQMAENLIRQAEEDDAETYAPLELKIAQEKLQEAQKAFAAKQYQAADEKAEESMTEARLAQAKTQAAKANKLLQNEKTDLEMLKNEIDRKKITN